MVLIGKVMTEYIEIEHPGGMLKDDFLDALNIRPATLAKAIRTDRAAIKNIIDGKRGISAEMALKLGLFFGTSAEFWINLQKDYELRIAKRQKLQEFSNYIEPFKAA